MSKHLTLNDRIIIKENLDKGISISKIAEILSKATSTVSCEITKNSAIVKKGAYGKPFNDCIHRKSCNLYGVCGNSDIICDKNALSVKCAITLAHAAKKNIAIVYRLLRMFVTAAFLLKAVLSKNLFISRIKHITPTKRF